MKKKKNNSTRQLMGVDAVTDVSLQTKQGELVYLLVRPTNLGVLPAASVTNRVRNLHDVLKGQMNIELLAVNSRETFSQNKEYYKKRMEAEELPALRRLLEQDGGHLDQIQTQMASARVFCFVLRLRERPDINILPLLSDVERSIRDCGFSVHHATRQELMQLLAVYYQQDSVTETFADYDGQHIVQEAERRLSHG